MCDHMNDLEVQYKYYECVIRLHELEYDFEIRGNGQNYTKGEHGRFTGSKPAGGSGKVSSKGLTNSHKNDIIKSETASGALNPESKRADEHAKRYYEAVRHMTTDVDRIAKNTGLNKDDISDIKNFVFIDKHDLGYSEPKRFDPSYEMAESWQRLIDGKNIQSHDLTLLKHEAMERKLMKQGYGQETAHRKTEKLYNYKKESEEYYAKINKHKN